MWKKLQECKNSDKQKITAATTDEILQNSALFEVTTASEISSASDEILFKIVSRSEWNATNPKNKLSDFQLPIDRIIIAHTSTRECYNRTECIKIVKDIQRIQMQPPANFDDIAYNFLIGGDGNVYEGQFEILRVLQP
jgi:N-acetylmuramoyl-L-alanine amidase